MNRYTYPSFPFVCTYPIYQYRPHSFYFTRDFPPVDTSTFKRSLKIMPKALADVSLFVEKMNGQKDLPYKMKEAAQQSNKNEVQRLIKSTGVQSDVDVSFNPDNIRILFLFNRDDFDCCHITLAIKW